MVNDDKGVFIIIDHLHSLFKANVPLKKLPAFTPIPLRTT
jgi:hypothetical protein